MKLPMVYKVAGNQISLTQILPTKSNNTLCT